MEKKQPKMDSLISSEDSNEYVNTITHSLGALLSIVGLIALLAFSTSRIHSFCFCVYGTTLFLSFATSTLMHFFLLRKKYVRFFGILDHNAIYLLIAGTYTPFCVVVLQGTWGWTIFGVVWGLALVNIVLKSIFFAKIPKSLSLLSYLVMGWLAVFIVRSMYQHLGVVPLVLIGIGGALYTGGSIVFFSERPNPFPPHFGNHEIWHLSVLTANSLFFCVMLFYVAPYSGA